MVNKGYTKEFKLGAARVVVDEGKKVSEVARDLGVSVSAVSKWSKDYKAHGGGSFPGKGFLAPQDEEMRKLKQALRRAEMERDLLKKTIALFAESDRRSITL